MGLGEMMGPPTKDKSIEGLGVLSSHKVKEFSFAVFYDEASIEKDFGHNIVATKKKEGR